MKIYVLVRQDDNGAMTFDMPHKFGRGVRAYKTESIAKAAARKFGKDSGVRVVEVKVPVDPFEIHFDEMPINTMFSQRTEDVFGKIVIAPSQKAQKQWELWRKNPTSYTLAPGYVVKKETDGVIEEAELMELSIVPKVKDK
tara:strand:+ start:1734 stop:2156 length:423 start_codon:yes stop_codon:yes gene_type:complete